VNDFQIGGWFGLLYAFVLLAISVGRNRRLIPEQLGFSVAALLPCQNIIPPIKFIWSSLTANHPLLLPPLYGLEKYLLVAGFASEMVTLISLYSLFVLATKQYPH
jgi:hypothetical protein